MNELTIRGTQSFMGKEIPVVLGGFGQDKKCISDKTIAEIHGMEIKHVRELINRSISRFREGTDYVDLKGVVQNDTLILLKSMRYSQQSIVQSAHIYILSKRGYAKLIKIMDTDLAWEIHDKLIDEYFELRDDGKQITCIEDVLKLHPEYTFLSFALFRVVTLVDKRRKTRVDHQIVEYREYPDTPEKNVVTLSSTVPKIQNTIDQIKVDMVEQDNNVRSDMQEAIENATDLITGAKGGNVKVTITNGKPTEILIMDTDDVNTCQRVWRWNIAGFAYSSNGINGSYTTAITMDGRIVADFITAGAMSANIIRGGVLQSQNGMLRFDLNNANMSVYNASGQLILRFNNTGLHFYDNGTYIGKIGTNQWKTRADIKGLVFDLDTDGGFLSWAKRVNPSDDFYTTMLYFFPDDRIDSQGLHLGTSLYTRNNSVHLDTQNHAYSEAWNNGAGFATAGTFVIADNANNFISRWQADRISFHKDLYMNGWDILNQSDERLKTNIRAPTVSALDILCRLQCVQFDWLEGGHEPLGVIAQQVQEIAPELVSEDENGVLSINQTRLIQYLLAAVKELAGLVIPSPMKMLFSTQEYSSNYTEEEKREFLQRIKENSHLIPAQPKPLDTLK